jgi:hypothetical protein
LALGRAEREGEHRLPVEEAASSWAAAQKKTIRAAEQDRPDVAGAAEYFQQKGTLQGFEGAKQISIRDLERAMEGPQSPAEVREDARAAIKQGVPRRRVIERLKQLDIDEKGL